MNSNLENQKMCPSCHELNKRDNNYCSYCGAILEGGESKKAEDTQISATSETNKQEITETLTGSKYGKLAGLLICLTLIELMVLVPALATPKDDPRGNIFFMVAMILLIFIIPGMLCGTGLIFWNYRGSSKPRTFFISDKEIKIILPDKPFFQIQWSEIVTVQIYKSESWRHDREFGRAKADPLGSGRRPSFFILNFYTNTGFHSTFGIERGLDFRKSTTDRIASLIGQYANRLHKEYIWGKNIQKVREKRMKKESKI